MLRDLKGARWVLVVVGLVAGGLLLSRNFISTSPPAPGADLVTVPADSAVDRVGETVRVCGRVAQARYVPSVDGRPVYTTSRILKAWEREGLLRSRRKRITVLRPHKLFAIAEDLPEAPSSE